MLPSCLKLCWRNEGEPDSESVRDPLPSPLLRTRAPNLAFPSPPSRDQSPTRIVLYKLDDTIMHLFLEHEIEQLGRIRISR